MNEDFRMYEELLEVSRKNLEEARKKMTEQKGYDLSKTIIDSATNEPWFITLKAKDAEGNPLKKNMTAKDIILQALRVRAQEDKLSESDISFSRKICKKIEASDASDVKLKSKAVQTIKERVRLVISSYDAVHQIMDAFDGDPTQAELDEV